MSRFVVGVIDSGVSGRVRSRVAETRSFTGDDDTADRLGHGTRICEIIADGLQGADLAVARVFADRPATKPGTIAEALDWLAGANVAIVNMSFGLAADRDVLAQTCRRAAERHIILIASAPARGRPCYPAAYPDVVSVTGDARCTPETHSVLDGIAEFGTWCASPEHEPSAAISGASIAAAHFTVLCARWLIANPGAGRDDLVAHMRQTASHFGPERRSVPDAG